MDLLMFNLNVHFGFQIQGLGTALKILFSGKFDKINTNNVEKLKMDKNFKLERSEIVALFNALGR